MAHQHVHQTATKRGQKGVLNGTWTCHQCRCGDTFGMVFAPDIPQYIPMEDPGNNEAGQSPDNPHPFGCMCYFFMNPPAID